MPSDCVIRASGLSKAYEVYRRPGDRVKQYLFGRRRKYYADFWALRDFAIDIRRGESIGIIGPNGSGKSTLLQLVCGITAPTAGELEVRGKLAAMLALGAGFAPELTGRENIFVAASVLGLSTAQIRQRFDSIVDFAGIGEFIDQPVRYYSTGMHARLAFAVNAHVDADILVIDEVLSVGDAAFGQKCMRFIRDFQKNGTVLFVSHDLGAVANLCNRSVWLDRGRIGAIGETAQVIHEYLSSLYAGKVGDGTFLTSATADDDAAAAAAAPPRVSGNRQFDTSAPWFGLRGATITDVTFTDARNVPLAQVRGGEAVILRITARAERDLAMPIAGFIVHDRLGQEVFVDNTFLAHCRDPVRIAAGQEFIGEFRFEMPHLKAGPYSICVAIAEGTQDDHVQHHWIGSAVQFEAVPSYPVFGVFRPSITGSLRVIGAHDERHRAPLLEPGEFA